MKGLNCGLCGYLSGILQGASLISLSVAESGALFICLLVASFVLIAKSATLASEIDIDRQTADGMPKYKDPSQ